MGVKRQPLWEVQWHPAAGGQVRRFTLTRGGLRRSIALLLGAVALLLAIVGVIPIGLQGFFARFTVDNAKRENVTLHAHSEELHEQAYRLGLHQRLVLQRSRRLAWVVGAAAESWREAAPTPPPRDADDRSLVAWLIANAARLEAAGTRLGAIDERTLPCPFVALPTGLPLDPRHGVPVAPFGWWTSPFTGREEAHNGTTLAAPLGEPVLAPGAARVLFAGAVRERRSSEWSRLGTVVVLEHGGGVYTILGHLRDVTVRRGQTAGRGQRVGSAGQTGWTRVPALYYEIRWPRGGASVPIDPALLALTLPLDAIDARLADPRAGLPDDFAPLDRFLGKR